MLGHFTRERGNDAKLLNRQRGRSECALPNRNSRTLTNERACNRGRSRTSRDANDTVTAKGELATFCSELRINRLSNQRLDDIAERGRHKLSRPAGRRRQGR